MTQEDIILMADASGLSYYGMGKDRERFIAHLQRFAELVAKGAAFAEREACAKVCDDKYAEYPEIDPDYAFALAASDLAKAIRARGQA
jgi:hypothetical protein